MNLKSLSWRPSRADLINKAATAKPGVTAHDVDSAINAKACLTEIRRLIEACPLSELLPTRNTNGLIHHLPRKRHPDVAQIYKALGQRGVNLGIGNMHGNTPAHIVLQHGVPIADKVAVLVAIQEYGGNLQALCKYGKTPEEQGIHGASQLVAQAEKYDGLEAYLKENPHRAAAAIFDINDDDVPNYSRPVHHASRFATWSSPHASHFALAAPKHSQAKAPTLGISPSHGLTQFRAHSWLTAAEFLQTSTSGSDTGYVNGKWGLGGAGVIITDQERARVALFKRSWNVADGGLWGVPGGARMQLPGGELDDALSTAVQLMREEAEHIPEDSTLYSTPFETRFNNYSYSTYVMRVNPKTFAPKLNWEHTEWAWYPLEVARQLIELHPGVRAVLGSTDTLPLPAKPAAAPVCTPAIPAPQTTPCKSLETVARERGTTVGGLEAHVHATVREWAEALRGAMSYGGSEYFPVLDMLYNLYRMSKQEAVKHPWLQHMRSFDGFIAHFCPEATAKSRAYIVNHLEAFVSGKVVGRWQQGGCPPTGYEVQGEWVPLPDDLSEPKAYLSEGRWAESPVIHETRALNSANYPRKDALIHGTGSAALEAIGRSGAILSARQALATGGSVKTGEFVSYIGHCGVSVSGGAHGLGEVYTSQGGLGGASYTMQRWFDEYPVCFAIDFAKQRAYNDARGIKRYYDNPSNEGVTVGPDVPLAHVTVVTAPKAKEAEVRSWLAQYCPHTLFISQEAARIYERI